MISSGTKWLIALIVLTAFAMGEEVGYWGAMHGRPPAAVVGGAAHD